MKKISHFLLLPFVAAALIMTAPSNASAQVFKNRPVYHTHHELTVSFGLIGMAGMDRYDDFYADIKKTYDLDDGFLCGFGAIYETINLQIAYFYHFNHRLAAGLLLTGNKHIWDPLDNHERLDPESLGHIYASTTSSSFGALPAIKYTWGYFRGGCFYSKAALGAYRQRLRFKSSNDDYYYGLTDSQNDSDVPYPEIDRKKWYFGHQLTPFGFEAGVRRIRGYAEVGWGVSGYVQIGMSLRLGQYQ